jgi:hypothetical protein
MALPMEIMTSGGAKCGKEKDLFLYVVDGKVQMISEHISKELSK